MFGEITRVGANFHAMESLANLKRVNGSIGQVQSRLSSGKRINSAEDDTSGYALSKHLQSRVNGLSQALNNVSTAKNVLNIAEGGYQSQMNILQQIKENLTQAADGALSDSQRGAIGDRIESLLTEFNDINDQTKYNGYVLFEESTMTFQVGEEESDTFDVNFDDSVRDSAGEGQTDIDDIFKSYYGSVLDSQSSGVFSASDALAAYTDGTTVVTVADSDGNTLGSNNYSVAADGEVTFTGDGIVADTYTISYSEGTDTSEVDVTLAADDNSNAFSELVQVQAQNGIEILDTAIKSLSKTIQQVGDDQTRLTSKEESLSLGISNTEATRSRIEDADFAKEQMTMMKLQILQQTSVAAFTQSNSAPQVVLSLFR